MENMAHTHRACPPPVVDKTGGFWASLVSGEIGAGLTTGTTISFVVVWLRLLTFARSYQVFGEAGRGRDEAEGERCLGPKRHVLTLG
jgi:hypothetical protein